MEMGDGSGKRNRDEAELMSESDSDEVDVRKRGRSRRRSASRSRPSSESSESESERRRRRRRKREKKKERKRLRGRSRRRSHSSESSESSEYLERRRRGKRGAVPGKYGTIGESVMRKKRPELRAWLADVKKVNMNLLSSDEEKRMQKKFIKHHNEATFPSKKYYDLDAYREREKKKSMKKNDEEQTRLELQRERERLKIGPKTKRETRKLMKAFDWRDSIIMNRIRHQGYSSSCWAVATCGVIDHMYLVRKGKQVETAPQELIDCMEPTDSQKLDRDCYDCTRCFKSTTERGHIYVKQIGVNHEKDYKYEAYRRLCRKNTETGRVQIKDFRLVDEGSSVNLEAEIIEMVKKHPVAATLRVDGGFRRLGAKAIYKGPVGTSRVEFHAGLIVGFDTEVLDGVKTNFWIFRNLYGVGWGDGGYGKVIRKSSQPIWQESVVTYMVYPILMDE